MDIEQRRWTESEGWSPSPPSVLTRSAQLVMAFGATHVLEQPAVFRMLRESYPEARLLCGSTAGEIYGTAVMDNSIVVTAVRFDHARVEGVATRLAEAGDAHRAGVRLGGMLSPDGLVHVFVLSDGLQVNGTALIAGLTSRLPPGVQVTGGLSADGERFARTLVGLDSAPAEGVVAAVGLYGDRLRVGFGSLGGWDPFGPERLITRARGNVLYELDGRSALELYKTYLGTYAADLPASALLFPLCVRTGDDPRGVVRTVLSVDERDQSMTFAGDLPEGAYARLMKANFDRLIDGASAAARASHESLGASSPDLGILISCVGRRMVLKQRVEEEVESVRGVLGARAVLAGFYSYGEISPVTPAARCELHNQTMTVTTLSEV